MFWFVLFSELFVKLSSKVIVWFRLSCFLWGWSWLNFCLSFLLLLTFCCWLLFFMDFKWLRIYVHDERWSWLKLLHIFFFIETHCLSKLFINNLIVTLFILSFFDCFSNPSAEFEMLSIDSCIDSKFKKFLTLPEFWWFQSFNFSHLRSDMILIFIIIIRNILTIMSCVSIFIKNEFAEIIVLENILLAGSKSVVDRNNSFSEGMNNPFWL